MHFRLYFSWLGLLKLFDFDDRVFNLQLEVNMYFVRSDEQLLTEFAFMSLH